MARNLNIQYGRGQSEEIQPHTAVNGGSNYGVLLQNAVLVRNEFENIKSFINNQNGLQNSNRNT